MAEVIIDESAHICRLCKAQKLRYKHIDMTDLEDKLRSSSGRLKLIVTDGAFSMDGDVAPLGYWGKGLGDAVMVIHK